MPEDSKPKKNWFVRAMTDSQEKISSMRVMSFLALIVAAGLAVANCVPGVQGDNLHVLYFLTAAFAPKAVQKFAENIQPKP